MPTCRSAPRNAVAALHDKKENSKKAQEQGSLDLAPSFFVPFFRVLVRETCRFFRHRVGAQQGLTRETFPA
jgi:hypothetical protein